MKIKAIALAISLSISASLHATGIPTVDVLANAISTLLLSEGVAQTAESITQTAEMIASKVVLMKQLKALTESGGFGDFLQSMAMDELRGLSPSISDLASVVDENGRFADYTVALRSLTDLADGNELMGSVSDLTESGLRIFHAYEGARRSASSGYAVSQVLRETMTKRSQLLRELGTKIETTSGPKQATDLNTVVQVTNGGTLADISLAQSETLRLMSEKEARETAELANYRASIRQYLVEKGVYD